MYIQDVYYQMRLELNITYVSETTAHRGVYVKLPWGNFPTEPYVTSKWGNFHGDVSRYFSMNR